MSSAPVVRVMLRADVDGGSAWAPVGPCPICKREHAEYAAGGPDADPRDALGLRLSLCAGRAEWIALEEAV